MSIFAVNYLCRELLRDHAFRAAMKADPANALDGKDLTDEERAAMPPVRQRLVRRCPDSGPGSGRKTLYLASHASHIVGWPVPDGMLLLRELIEHATQPEVVHRHQWRVGDLVIWDNRCTMHRGRRYAETQRRDLRRITTQDTASAFDQVA